MNGFSQFFSDRLYVAVWFEAIGTMGALFWLTWDFTWKRPRREKDQREEERLAWARSVGYRTWLHFESLEPPWRFTFDWHVLNAGKFPVSDAKLVFLDPMSSEPVCLASRFIGTLLPGIAMGLGEERIEVAYEDHVPKGNDFAVLEFVDVWGVRWHRTQGGLEEDVDPLPLPNGGQVFSKELFDLIYKKKPPSKD